MVLNMQQMSKMRREFHQIAEPGWLEFQTTIRIIEYLKSFGYYDISYGRAIHGERIGLPSEKKMKDYSNSLSFEVDFDISEILEGYTGVVAKLDTGREGHTIALRFDIDANDVQETYEESHVPNKFNFRSINNLAMHACGHDGHITIGLSIAKWLIEEKDNLRGKFILIFQPAEEGVRGAKSMVEAGVLNGVDYLLAGHIGLGVESGILALGSVGFLATTKLDIYFEGVSSHAGKSPELGKNALLAAASCALNLHTLTQFASGMTRLNVGILNAGSGRNVIPANAVMQIEIRGENEEVKEALRKKVYNVIQGAAKSFDVNYKVVEAGSAPSYNTYDKEFIDMVSSHLKEKGFKIDVGRNFGGSEDVTYMMNEVETNGGQALYIIFGSNLKAPHHNSKFDFEEETLEMAFNALKNLVIFLA